MTSKTPAVSMILIDVYLAQACQAEKDGDFKSAQRLFNLALKYDLEIR